MAIQKSAPGAMTAQVCTPLHVWNRDAAHGPCARAQSVVLEHGLILQRRNFMGTGASGRVGARVRVCVWAREMCSQRPSLGSGMLSSMMLQRGCLSNLCNPDIQ